MFDSFIKLVIGDIDEKRAYGRFKRRVKALPNDYRFAFRKIQHYIYSIGFPGSDMAVFTNLLDLFEASAAEGRPLLEVTGPNLGQFSNELLRASSEGKDALREKLNKDVQERLGKGGKADHGLY